ncbi:MAG: hypothetical protein HZB38_18875 [Planctomycetes bacterium]|nr:hypothetical protein [Planctomycetota bacterium]
MATSPRRMTAITVCSCFLSMAGCFAPQWHQGGPNPNLHTIQRAAVIQGALSIQGHLPLYGYSNYGVRLNRAVDDRGQELQLKSAAIWWSKEERFELELDPPHSQATQVTIDVSFSTRAGVQRIEKTLPIDRSGTIVYGTELSRWNRPNRQNSGGKR